MYLFTKGMKDESHMFLVTRIVKCISDENCTTVDVVRTRVVLLYLLRLFYSSIVSLSNS